MKGNKVYVSLASQLGEGPCLLPPPPLATAFHHARSQSKHTPELSSTPPSLVGLFAPLCASQHSRAAIRVDPGGDLSERASTASERGASQQPSSRFCCSGNLRRISTGSMLCWLLFCHGWLSLLWYLLKHEESDFRTMPSISDLNVVLAYIS